MHNGKTVSLISYLSSACGFCLDIDRCRIEESADRQTPCKFGESCDSGPFSRLLGARIISAGNSHVKNVFLLMQKEVYSHATDELRPVTNHDIEGYWQRTFELYADNDQDPACLILAGQTDQPHHCTLWQSLFFCHHRQLFFHPPCPVCGHDLHLCRDDDVLTGMGLRPYTTSLKRYLYCPFCHDVAGQSDFFTYELTQCDPAFVHDRWDLIRKIGHLKAGPDDSKHFPCLDCSEHEKCHGPDGSARTRIEIFNFYPSYMMIFPGGSINAIDFLALVSGASQTQLQRYLADRHQNSRMKYLQASGILQDQGPYFMFRHSSRFFLEVLYLKLNFMAGLFQSILPALKNLRSPDMGLSLDRFWVKTARRTGLIPHLWNFTVYRIDLGDVGGKPLQIPKNPPSYGFYFLGTIWFFTLLANSRQSSSTIYEALQSILKSETEKPGTGSADFETALKNPVFAPENIFWNSGEAQIPDEMNTIWQKTLETGRLLLSSHVYHGESGDIENFQQKLTALLKTVREQLFPPAGDVETPDQKTEMKDLSDQEHRIIGNILEKIGRKWSAPMENDFPKPNLPLNEPPTEQDAPPKMEQDAPGVDLDETLIMGSGHGDRGSAVPDREASPAPMQTEKPGFAIKTTRSSEEKPIYETIILSSEIFNDMDKDSAGHTKRSEATLSVFPTDNGPSHFFEDHTMIQPPVGSVEKHLNPADPEDSSVDGFTGTAEIEETLILSPADKKRAPWPRKDDPAETVILSSGADSKNITNRSEKPDKWPSGEKNDAAGDDLAETVILSSRPKTGNGK